jgi:hypothetical protein
MFAAGRTRWRRDTERERERERLTERQTMRKKAGGIDEGGKGDN